jgi:uncharacterized phage protein (TIGR02218 family)
VRPAPAALINYLASAAEFTWIDLYTFLLAGTTLRYSGTTLPLVIPGTAWDSNSGSLNYATGTSWTFALGPRFGRSKVNTKIGIEATSVDIKVMAGPDDLIGTFTWQQAVYNGLFDGATVELDRFLAGPGGPTDTSLGAIVWFYGLVADADFGRTSVKLKIQSPLGLMNHQQMPRRIYSSSCTHVFGDAMCQFDRSSMAAAVAALSGSGQTVIHTGLSPSPSTLYDQGTISATSGANGGSLRTIDSLDSSGTAFVRGLGFLHPVAAGDTFTLLPGCDHSIPTCNGTFNNLLHYGGMPYIPPPETAV